MFKKDKAMEFVKKNIMGKANLNVFDTNLLLNPALNKFKEDIKRDELSSVDLLGSINNGIIDNEHKLKNYIFENPNV